MNRYSHAAAAVMRGDMVHIVSFGGLNGVVYLAVTAVTEMGECLLGVLANICM